MKERSTFLTAFGIGRAIATNRANKKALKQVRQFNQQNRGITYYTFSPVEAFFPLDDPLGNVALSGGEPRWRLRAVTRLCECALAQGYAPVLLHAGNQELVAYLAQYFGGIPVARFDHANPFYDPFVGRSNAQIDRLILDACAKDAPIKPTGKYYLDGISDFIRARGRSPAAYMFIGCPHQDLIQQVNRAATDGKISSQAAQNILSQLLQGETERGSVENFFLLLDSHAGRLLARKPNIARACSMRSTVSQGQIFAADVTSDANAYLIQMLLAEARELLAEGIRLLLVVDGIQIAANDRLKAFVQAGGGSAPVLISADDVFASFGGNETDFFAFTAKAVKIAISKHGSAHSAQRWADLIGSYDKLDVSSTSASNVNYFNRFGLGYTSSNTVSEKREHIVKPDEILRLGRSEAIILRADSAEVARVQFL